MPGLLCASLLVRKPISLPRLKLKPVGDHPGDGLPAEEGNALVVPAVCRITLFEDVEELATLPYLQHLAKFEGHVCQFGIAVIGIFSSGASLPTFSLNLRPRATWSMRGRIWSGPAAPAVLISLIASLTSSGLKGLSRLGQGEFSMMGVWFATKLSTSAYQSSSKRASSVGLPSLS